MPLPRKVHTVWTKQKVKDACRLYAVTDSSHLHGSSLPSLVADAIVGGATFVQLRKKDDDTLGHIKMARALAPICRVANIPFVIDDDIEAAKATGVDGVHLGKDDISCIEARRMLGDNAIIGVSARCVEEAKRARFEGASYIGVGPVFGSSSNPAAQLLPVATVRDMCNSVDIPVVAIGGMTPSTIPRLEGVGLSGIAARTSLFGQEDVEEAARSLREAVDTSLF